MEDRIDEGLERVTEGDEDEVEAHKRRVVKANDTAGDEFEDDVEAHRKRVL